MIGQVTYQELAKRLHLATGLLVENTDRMCRMAEELLPDEETQELVRRNHRSVRRTAALLVEGVPDPGEGE